MKRREIDEMKNENHPNFFWRIKGLLFPKFTLRRPIYVIIPFLILIISMNLFLAMIRNSYCPFELQITIIAIVVLIALAMFFDILLMIRANKDFFRNESNKKRYLKSQFAQLAMLLIIIIPIFGSIMGSIHDTDPDWVKDSVVWTIEPDYGGVWPTFSEGLATVEEWGKVGFIDKEGTVVIPLRYREASNFSEGLAAVKQKGKWGYIDKAGNEVLPFVYEEAMAFSGGVAPVKIQSTWSVINRDGEVLFETDFERIDPYSEGVARVVYRDEKDMRLEKQNVIDEAGRLLFTKGYVQLGQFSEGCIPAMEEETGLFYFLDKNEEKVIDRSFAFADSFSGGMAAVAFDHGSKTVYIDRRGDVISTGENDFSPFRYHEGLVRFKEGERFGFKDINGNVVIPPNFLLATDSSDGMIGLQVDRRWGFVENPLLGEL
jgi:hypothetical protein